MIVSQEHRYAYLMPPKTGTQTMRNVLTRHYGGELLGMHSMSPVPPFVEFTFCTVRNPYARAVSLWHSMLIRLVETDRYGLRRACMSDEFLPFLRWLVAVDKDRWDRSPEIDRIAWVPLWNQSDFIGDRKVDVTLRCEDLNEEVRRLPFWDSGVGVPRMNADVTRKRHWSAFCQSPEVRLLIEGWAGEDFDRFGYSREIPTCASR